MLAVTVAMMNADFFQNKELERFVLDAQRFIALFWEPITQSAPHIYISALSLAPAESEICRKFSSQFPQLLKVSKGGMKQWPNIVAILRGHTDLVTSVAFSPDGKR